MDITSREFCRLLEQEIAREQIKRLREEQDGSRKTDTSMYVFIDNESIEQDEPNLFFTIDS